MPLYPFISKYFKFTIGHPVIHMRDVCQDMEAILQKDGMTKCAILSPKRFHHPVLPFRCNNRLLFCLCRTCVIWKDRTKVCTYETVAEKGLTGTWVKDEIRLALQKGYEHVELHDVYEYQMTQYDPQTGNGGHSKIRHGLQHCGPQCG